MFLCECLSATLNIANAPLGCPYIKEADTKGIHSAILGRIRYSRGYGIDRVETNARVYSKLISRGKLTTLHTALHIKNKKDIEMTNKFPKHYIEN